MIKIAGYRFFDRVYDNTHIAIYRGTRDRDSLPVIAKALKARYPSPKELNQLEHEYNIGRSLNIPGVVKYYSLENVGYGKAIIMEDFGAISLARYIRSHQVDMQIILKIIIAAGDIIEKIHRNNTIHKDINPYNILINPETKSVKISDFSISAKVKRETQTALEPERLTGTLSYIAPEQTGRMNRSIDYRTDFYSLGVTFYEMLTGKRPFELDDPMELVHAHIARKAPEPDEINKAIPQVISKIVMKLLSKNAEDRYQSIPGLKADLEECYNQFQSTGLIEDFPIGRHDKSDKLLIPEKRYGRDNEIKLLTELFDRTAKGDKIIALFSGPAGIGKSDLINELHKPAAGRRSYFIEGKYGRAGSIIPNSAIIEAFSGLIMQLLTAKSTQLEKWKNEILAAVGSNGKILIDVLPRIELVIGDQPEVPELPPLETENRLNMVLMGLIKVFARRAHPLILFLDDLQWADEAGLQLIDALFEDPELTHFLLVGAYRMDEVDSAHLLARMIKKWQASFRKERDKECLDVKLKRLNTGVIAQLLADTLYCTVDEVKSLAELVHKKTNGNPFFIHEFLKKLWNDHMITFDEGWTWDITEIQQASITENVVELMTGKLKQLPGKTLTALKTAACVGAEFSFQLAAQVLEKTEDSLLYDLKHAMDKGILLKIGEKGKFSHNKIQEAVYLMMDETERRELHLKIGKSKWQKTGEEVDETDIFDIVNHLNRAGDLVSGNDKIEIARLNLAAGLKAKTAIAYDVAYRFFKQGIALLPQPVNLAWQQEYELTLALYTAGSEVGYLNGQHEEAEKLFHAVLKNAKNLLHKTRIYETKIHVFVSRQRNIEAVKLCRKALKILGVQMPARASKLAILKEFAAVHFRFTARKGGTSSLNDLPELTDPVKLAVARILTTCTEPAYLSDAAYFPIVVLKLLNQTLKHGNSQYSAYAYVVYGSILCDLLGNIDGGHRFGKLALEMLRQFPGGGLKAKIYFIYGTGINHWKKPLRRDLEYLQKAYKSGSETGDLSYASYAVNSYIFRLFFVGESLSEIKKAIDTYYPVLKKYNQLGCIHECELWQYFVSTLSGDIEGTLLIQDKKEGELAFVKQWSTDKDMNRLGNYTLVRLMLLTVLGYFREAIKVAQEGEKYVESIVGDVFSPEFYFYFSLAILGSHARGDVGNQSGWSSKLTAFEKRMEKWAKYAPENYRHKYLLIKAGRCSLSGKAGEATALFSRAINLARENGFRHEEALACEYAAHFYFSLGIEDIALEYTKKAHYLYELWNADAKVKDLEHKHPELVESTLGGKGTASTSSSESTTPSLDFDAIIKASQIISGEIVLEKLLEKLLKIVMENAGAQKIYLILKKDDKLLVQAGGKTDEREVSVFQGFPIEEYDLPHSVIRFVARTKDLVVIDDSSRDSPFSQDLYLLDRQPMSLLCMAVVHQDALVGILYLENQLVLNAFTGEQQETLKVLAAQAAVSLQNALFYENLTLAEKRVRTILDTTNEGFLEIDDKGMITGVNPGMCAIANRGKDELLGASFFKLLSPGDRELALQQFRIHNLDKSSSYKLNIVKPDNSLILCLINATPLFDKEGNKQGSFAMVTDLTEYEKKDKQLRQAQKMETVGTLAGGLAHDFNNILGGITGSLSLLQMETKKKERDPKEIEKYLDDMVEAAGRAVDIVRQLLSLSRKEELTFEPVDLNASLRSVMKICRNTFEKRIELNPVYHDESAVVLADPTQLEQVLLNLAVNAAHAMTIMRKEGQRWGGTLTVSIDKIYTDLDFSEAHPNAEDGYYWKITISDEGVGIDAETLSKIFEPFFTTKLKGKGTGLGLSMVYNIVKQHKGFMDVQAEPGKGSTFTIYLPEYREVLGFDIKKKEKEIFAGEGLILVIDDEPIMRKIAMKILEKAGYNLIFAEDGEEGIELFRKRHQDLEMVLLDMQMPKKSGQETYIEMRKINPEVKVLLASGFQRDERVEAILRLGVHGFIEKPYTFGQLVNAVQSVIGATTDST